MKPFLPIPNCHGKITHICWALKIVYGKLACVNYQLAIAKKAYLQAKAEQVQFILNASKQ